MKFWQIIYIVAIFTAVECVLGHVSYKGYKVYDITPNTEQHKELSSWEFVDGIDIWRLFAPNRTSQVMVSPEKQKDFEEFLVQNEIPFNVSVTNFEAVLQEEQISIKRDNVELSPAFPGMRPDFSVYWSSREIESYCIVLAALYPNIVALETLTMSPEGRRIYALKISSGTTFGQKPIIAMEGGMHAREWAVPPTILYLLYRLIQDPNSSAELLEKVDWLIVPMLNPDGYEYTRNVDRMWRKNRRNVTISCLGVDLNRNFPYSWRFPMTPCNTETFPSFRPYSEVESFHLNRIVSRYASNVKLYLSVHTFGDMVLWPWGYAGSPGWIHSHAEHQALGVLWRNSILANGGRNYIVGNVADVLGNAFGAVDDHMAGVHNIPYVYTLELTSGYGFIYPQSKIEALAFETFHGYRAMALHIGQKFG